MISTSELHESERNPQITRVRQETRRDVWDIEVFFDGECPLCRREIAMLQGLDRRKRIRFTDIAVKDFDAADCAISRQELMSEIHARLADGTWITGVEVFRRLYGAVGFRWLIPFTRLPGISCGLELGYRVFARNRLKWTGRCSEGGTSCELDKTTELNAQVVNER